jgi:hypothetical protein
MSDIEILRHLTWNAHNSCVPQSIPDPPTFESAEQEFSGFLRGQKLSSENVVVNAR